MLGRSASLPKGLGGVVRDAGSLHHYSVSEGKPRNEIDSAISWLSEVEDQAKNSSLHKALLAQLEGADDCHGLPEALIHPDPVMKNLIETPKNGNVLIDWTGAGRGPRVASLAVLIWSGALVKGSWSPQNVDAVVSGYRKHIQLETEELERLSGAMMIRQLVFAAWRYRFAIISGQAPTGTEWWWPSETLTQAISARARTPFGTKVQQ